MLEKCRRVLYAMWADVSIQTERMTLRRFTVDDADVLLELDLDPAVRRFVEDGEPATSG